MKIKTLLTMILTLCAANAFATGAGGLLIATSEAREKEINLYAAECGRAYPDTPNDIKQKCADDKRRLVKELGELAKWCDEMAADVADASKNAAAAWKLQGRAARFYAKYPGTRYQNDAEGRAEASAIAQERARILKENPDSTFAKVGLLWDDSIAWLKGE
jgi:hypothetical protein